MKRQRMNYKKSRADFARKSGIHPRNVPEYNPRGGIRL